MTVLTMPERDTALCPKCGDDPTVCQCVVDGLTQKATPEAGFEATSKAVKTKLKNGLERIEDRSGALGIFYDIREARILRQEAREAVAKAGADIILMYPDGDVWFSYKKQRFVVLRWDYTNKAELRELVTQQLDAWDAEHPDKPAGKAARA